MDSESEKAAPYYGIACFHYDKFSFSVTDLSRMKVLSEAARVGFFGATLF